MFLYALSDYMDMPDKITIVVKDRRDLYDLPCKISLSAIVCVIEEATEEYPLKDDWTTFYVCKDHACFPASNAIFED